MENKLRLVGDVLSEPTLEERFVADNIYSFILGVIDQRSSKYIEVPVRISDRFEAFKDIHKGVSLAIDAVIRSTNKRVNDDTYKKLLVTAFCTSVQVIDEVKEYVNDGVIEGEIAKEPFFHPAENGNPHRCNFMLKSERGFGKYVYLPITLRGRNAEMAKHQAVGTKVHCIGRLRTRKYNKTGDSGDKVQNETVEFFANGMNIMTDDETPSETQSAESAAQDVSGATGKPGVQGDVQNEPDTPHVSDKQGKDAVVSVLNAPVAFDMPDDAAKKKHKKKKRKK